MTVCAAAVVLLLLLLPLHVVADLVSVHPQVVPTDSTTLHPTGDGHGGLLAGTAFAGNSSVPAGKTWCCDFSGCSSAIGGETKVTLYSSTHGSCLTPNVTATGQTAVQLDFDKFSFRLWDPFLEY